MPLGEHELIAVAQVLVENHEHGVKRRKVSADVPDAALEMHLQQSFAGRAEIGRIELSGIHCQRRRFIVLYTKVYTFCAPALLRASKTRTRVPLEPPERLSAGS